MKFTTSSATHMKLWLLLLNCHINTSVIVNRFLPDKAIDLVDEAGSRVRLRHAQLPEEARELDKELRQITKEKNEAVRGQDFEKAGELRNRKMELKAQISALTDKGKEQSQAEAEASDTGPLVTEVDIQLIVSSWTAVPVSVSRTQIVRLQVSSFRGPPVSVSPNSQKLLPPTTLGRRRP